MKDEDELEKLLGEIPQATSPLSLQNLINNSSSNHHHDNHGQNHASCVTQRMNGLSYRGNNFHHMVDDEESIKCKYAFASSPVTASGFPLTSDDSHSNSSSSPPQFEEVIKPHSSSSDCNAIDLEFSRNFSTKMNIREEMVPRYGIQHCDQSLNESTQDFLRYVASDSYRNGFSHPKKPMSFVGEASSTWVGMTGVHRVANFLGSHNSTISSGRFYRSDFSNSQLNRSNVLANSSYPKEFMVPNVQSCSDNPPVSSPLFYSSPNMMNLIGASGSSYPSSNNMTHEMPHYNDRNLMHYQQSVPNGRNKVSLRVREVVDREDSLVIQGGGIGYRTTRNARSRGHNAKSENGAWKAQDKRSQLNDNAAIQEGYQSSKIHCPLNRPWKFSSLTEARGYMYHMAKDQQGCRFLQRMFDEGTSRDVEIIFNEIIDHAVELMMTPFGNYLMQKLLEVCSEEQKMHILFRVTEEPGELVRISLNTYGTRVVQKLVETLNTKHQISLVISALEPGFLALMKDLNGSHLIKRCLQCFPSEDSKFFFVAAAKYCVDIATHQNGCCALQSCIKHSTGEHLENFVAEISTNGLLLAEDAYGNYVVQFILEEIRYATSKLISQFEGNYVNLSTQKFSSHVVEKCLWVCNEETRAKIIHELLSASCFDQLLQDPFGNYVIQTALRVSEGHIRDSLVDAIESYKPVSRNSPYSKKIFSQKLSKR